MEVRPRRTRLQLPLMLPGETNVAPPDGTVAAFSGTGTPAATGDTMNVLTADLQTKANALFGSGAPLSDLIGLTVQITSGNGLGRFWQIMGVAAGPSGTTVLALLNPTVIPAQWTTLPNSSSSYVVNSLSANFFVNENQQVDSMTVYDDAAPASTGTLAGNAQGIQLTGFGMGGTLDYHNLESVEFFLGNGGNTVNVTGNLEPDNGLQTVTVINTGAGNDHVTVSLNATVGGIFSLNMEDGDDYVDASASTLPLIIFGGKGSNTIKGGQGGDIIFGHEGRVDYYNATGSLITRLGLGLSERTTLTPGQTATTDTDVPYYQTDDLVHPATLITTRDVGGSGSAVDAITGGAGNDVILGSGAGDTINAGNGNNIIIGGYGEVAATAVGVITTIESTSPTLGGSDTITAGTGNNVIIGAAGNNTINVGNGNNIVFGDNGIVQYDPSSGILASIATTSPTIGGNNRITAGDGNNIVLGGTGSDTITVGDGNNTIFGDDGSIQFFSSGMASLIQTADPELAANNTITVGNGDNIIFGGSGSDTITAGNGDNIVLGDNGMVRYQSSGVLGTIQATNSGIGGTDTITAGDGNNIILGGTGSDTITVGDGNNTIFGDDGSIQFFSSGMASLIQTTDPELAANNVITAGNGDNIIFGGSGADRITARDGNNIIFGDNGMVQYQASGLVASLATTNPTVGGNDVIRAGDGNNIILGGTGSDTITVGDGNNTIFGDDGSIQFFSSGMANLIQTTDPELAANNVITAGNGDNIIFGGSGSDTITAGNGDNIVLGDNGMVRYQSSGVLGTIQTTNSGTGGDNVITAGNGSNYVFGGFGNNVITLGGVTSTSPGASSASIVIGHTGEIEFDPTGTSLTAAQPQAGLFQAYSIDNGTAAAVYSTDNNIGGNDVVTVAAGNNILIGGAGNNSLYGGTGNDVIFGAGGKITWAGNTEIVESVDILMGGHDLLSGGGGKNIMIGGIGNSAFIGSFTSDIMIGRFAYIVIVSGRVQQVASFWFGDDPLASPLSSVYSASNSGNGQSSLQPLATLFVGQAAWATGLPSGTEFQVGSPMVAFNTAPTDLQTQQQEQSSHPGSYDVSGAPSGGPASDGAASTSQPDQQPSQGPDQQVQPPQQQPTPPGPGGQPQGGQGQPTSPPGPQGGSTQPPQGGNQGGQQQVGSKGKPAGVPADEGRLEVKEGFMAFGTVAAWNAGKEVRLNREGFKRLKEEQRRRRFLPWFGGEAARKSGGRIGVIK